jgi:hypothetical protein
MLIYASAIADILLFHIEVTTALHAGINVAATAMLRRLIYNPEKFKSDTCDTQIVYEPVTVVYF